MDARPNIVLVHGADDIARLRQVLNLQGGLTG